MRYRDAGVDVGGGDAVKRELARHVERTWGEAVRPLRGGFAGLIEWPGGGPLLAASMDGVGTKLHLALEAGRVESAAADLVYHGANDVLCHGARPLAFLDYIAQSRLEPTVVLAVVEGLAAACREVRCALLGGETAQMPDTYRPDVVDVAGCMIGWVDAALVLDGSRVRPRDRLLGLASEGLHTNGFSLARRILAASGLGFDAPLPNDPSRRVGEALLARHRPYGGSLFPQIQRGRIHALAHITGGGLAGNLVRVLPEGCRARVRASSWTWPSVFAWLEQAGPVPREDMRATFNLGIGMVACVARGDASGVAAALRALGEEVVEIGEVVEGERGVEWVD